MSVKITFQMAARSETGRVRGNNEDSLYIAGSSLASGGQDRFRYEGKDKAGSFACAVCDGMGGQSSGEVASSEAVKRFGQAVGSADFSALLLQEKIRRVNTYVGETSAAIYNMAAGSLASRGMGTTFAGLLFGEGKAVAMHVGDSRIYLHRDGFLKQLTRDHSESERKVRLGILTPEQAKTDKSRHVLSRHFGMPPEEGWLEADVSPEIDLKPGDRFLLCSDGLTDMVEQEQLQKIVADIQDTGATVDALIDAALSNGGKDNVTAILIDVEAVEQEKAKAHIAASLPGRFSAIHIKRKWPVYIAVMLILVTLVIILLKQAPRTEQLQEPPITSPVTVQVTEPQQPLDLPVTFNPAAAVTVYVEFSPIPDGTAVGTEAPAVPEQTPRKILITLTGR